MDNVSFTQVDWNPKAILVKPKTRKFEPIRRGENINTGGACIGCGNKLYFWFTYQMCEHCIKPRRPERSHY